jgi:hypothetical protein
MRENAEFWLNLNRLSELLKLFSDLTLCASSCASGAFASANGKLI